MSWNELCMYFVCGVIPIHIGDTFDVEVKFVAIIDHRDF